MPKVSVIVPVYNVELYVGKCIDSLAKQTLDDIEIIVVNDGSTDRTEEVVKRKIEKYNDKNIILFNKENGGQGDARNFGIEKATGEYIGFVDGDDYVESNMFEEMYKKSEEYKFDIIVCNVNCRYPNKNVEIESGIAKDIREMTIEDKKNVIFSSYTVVWNKIYKRSILTKEKLFEKSIWFEDVLFSYILFPFINSVGVVHKTLCNYNQRAKSITYTYNEKLYDIYEVLNKIKIVYEEAGIMNDYEDIYEYVYVRYMCATFIKRLAKTKDKKAFNEGVNFALKKVKENFKDYRKNKYLNKIGLKGFYLKHFNRFFANIIYLWEKNKMN